MIHQDFSTITRSHALCIQILGLRGWSFASANLVVLLEEQSLGKPTEHPYVRLLHQAHIGIEHG